MTALAELLRGPATAGVYRVPAGTADAAIARIAAESGWRLVHLDTGEATDKRAVLAAFKEALGFPDWFGHNLDALAECLRDVAVEPGTLLLWDSADRFAVADGAQYHKVLEVLRDRAADGQAARVLTVLRGSA